MKKRDHAQLAGMTRAPDKLTRMCVLLLPAVSGALHLADCRSYDGVPPAMLKPRNFFLWLALTITGLGLGIFFIVPFIDPSPIREPHEVHPDELMRYLIFSGPERIPRWFLYLLLTPVVLGFARRLRPLVSSRIGLLAHVIFVAAFPLLHFMIFVSNLLVIRFLISDAAAFPVAAWSMLQSEALWYLRTLLAIDLIFVAAVLGSYYAVSYYHDLQNRAITTVVLQEKLITARHEALRSQLNPHFLFNTLNTISVLAQTGDQDGVVETVARLSHLLRRSLDADSPPYVRLANELEFVDSYLDIERSRFGDRLVVRRDIERDALAALVPSMILQPIVENAIKHGVSQRCGQQLIGLDISRKQDALWLRISDSGPGFGTSWHANGIGLKNTRERLTLLYGVASRLEYGESSEGGALVTISIPFVCEEVPHQALRS